MCPPVPTEGAGLFLRGGWLGYCLNLGLILPSSHLSSSLSCQGIVKSLLICLASSYCTDKTLLFWQSLVLIFPALSRRGKKSSGGLLFSLVFLWWGAVPVPEQLCICSPQCPSLPLHTAPLPSPRLSRTCQPGLSACKRHARSMSLSCEDKSQVPAPARPSLPLPQSLVHHLHWSHRYDCHSLLSGGEISLPQEPCCSCRKTSLGEK